MAARYGFLMSVGGALALACHGARPPAPPPPPPALVVPSDTPPPPRRAPRGGALTAGERDSIVREAQSRRAAWRARGVTDYSIRVAVGCFCPWPSTPAILEVRGGVAKALRDTAGRPFGQLREPWSKYTVEGLFDAVEQSAQRSDVVEVDYDALLGYPTYLRGTGRVGLPDNWFWVRASQLRFQP
jgi:uncharacterized protein DUF6174